MPKKAKPALRRTLLVPQPATGEGKSYQSGRNLFRSVPSADRQCLRTFREVGTKAAGKGGVDVTAFRYLRDICSKCLGRELACNGTIEGYVDRSARMQMSVSRFFTFQIHWSTSSAVIGSASVLLRLDGTVGLPWNVRCKELIGRANVNDGDVLFLGEQ